MRKLKISLLTLLAIALAAPMFAQDAGTQPTEVKKQKKKTGFIPMTHMQIRYASVKDDADSTAYPPADFQEPNWYFNKVRVGMNYISGDKTYGGMTYWDLVQSMTGANNPNPRIIYAYGWWKPMDMVKLTFGQFKLPITRETTRSSKTYYAGGDTNFVGVEGSNEKLLGSLFDTGLRADFMVMPKLDLTLSITNGHTKQTGLAWDQAGSSKDAYEDNHATSPLFVFRGAYQVLGKKMKTGAEAWGKGMGFNAALFAAYSADKMANVTGYTPTPADSVAYMAFGTDGSFYMDGLVFNYVFAYQSSTYDPGTTGSESVSFSDIDLMTELGYKLMVGKHGLMPAFRLEYGMGSTDEKTGDNKSKADVSDMAFGIAVNFFWNNIKHNQKLSLAFMNVTDQSRDVADETKTTEKKQQTFVFEYQFGF